MKLLLDNIRNINLHKYVIIKNRKKLTGCYQYLQIEMYL